MFSANKCLSDIEAGMDHLHSLGIVHCDIKPRNIFVSSSYDHFVIGDFDSCYRKGAFMDQKKGTRGWTLRRFVYANRENDFHGLSIIRYWLEHKGWGCPVEGKEYIDTERISAFLGEARDECVALESA